MSLSKNFYVAYGVLAAMTVGYCGLVWLGLGVSTSLISVEMQKELPLVTRIAGEYSVIWFWQILAGISLVVNFAWGMVRSKSMSPWEAHSLPLICHLSWIVLCCFWNAIGAISPHIMWIYTLAPGN